MIVLRNIRSEDLDAIHEINEANTPHVNSVPVSWLDEIRDHAAYFKVAEVDGKIGGFLIGLTPGVEYDSLNYQWFTEQYDSFVYVDRIITAEWARGRGVARSLYQNVVEFTKGVAPTLVCEINLHPPNPVSIAFHESFGFKPVGTQETDGGAKTVSLMALDVTGA